MKDKEQDMLLKAAMERRAAKVPPLSEGFGGKVLEKMRERRRNVRRTIALWVSGIAAALVITFLLWPKGGQEPLPVLPPIATPSIIAEAVSKQPLKPDVPDEPINPIIPIKHHIKPKKPAKPAAQPKQETAEVAIAELTPSPLEKTEERQEEEPVIPADKQALADMFLAEEALQVAYEMQAQQEAIRAYAASLSGKTLPQPIIAF